MLDNSPKTVPGPDSAVMKPGYTSVLWSDDSLILLDQTQLPGKAEEITMGSVDDLIAAIKRLSVRGAPAIGVAGAYGVAIAVREFSDDSAARDAAIERIATARPTAVNLAVMVRRAAGYVGDGFDRVLAEAHTIADEERAASTAMGLRGAQLVTELIDRRPLRPMTICNTGGLATVGRGTAFAVLHALFEQDSLEHVLACETRPLLQGARLTMWELAQLSIPARLIVDSAGPALLARGAADVVLTGADRVARNGDTANKIGTYSLALGARQAGVPFIVVAPESTIDFELASGDGIEIEDRNDGEVAAFGGMPTSPAGTKAFNPAFDVTPASLITAVVTDQRVFRPDQDGTLERLI